MTLKARMYIYKPCRNCVQNTWSVFALEEEIFLYVSRASSKESRRTFLFPELSQNDFGHQEERT